MWLTVALERKGSDKRLAIADCASVEMHSIEADARNALRNNLRAGDQLVGLFQMEGVYDADITILKKE